MTLYIGPAVPVPASQAVMDALQSVEVTQSAGSHGAFQLRFNVSTNSPLQTIFLVSGGAVPPLVRLVIVVMVNGTPQVLSDGVVTTTAITAGATPS